MRCLKCDEEVEIWNSKPLSYKCYKCGYSWNPLIEFTYDSNTKVLEK